MQQRTMRIVAYKRKSNEMIQGTCLYDGLQAIVYVDDDEMPTASPTSVCLPLDRVVTFEEV